MVPAFFVNFVMLVPDSANVLDGDSLREIDQVLLDYLQEGRITPVYARERIVSEGVRESITEQYCQQRLKRLAEHEHVENLFDIGLYQLRMDPRRYKQ